MNDDELKPIHEYEYVAQLDNFVERIKNAEAPTQKAEEVYQASIWFSNLNELEQMDVFLSLLGQYESK